MPPPECSSPSIPGKNPPPGNDHSPSSRTGAASGNAQAGTHHSRYRGKRSPLRTLKRRMRKRNARNKRLRRNGKKRRRKNVSAGKKPRRNVWPRNAARRNKPLATRWPEPLVWETPRVTAKATLKAEPVTKEVRSVTLITGRMKA